MADLRVGDQVHTDVDTEIGVIRYMYAALSDDVTVEYQSNRGAGTYTENWPSSKLVLHARAVYVTADRIAVMERLFGEEPDQRDCDVDEHDKCPRCEDIFVMRAMLAEAQP